MACRQLAYPPWVLYAFDPLTCGQFLQHRAATLDRRRGRAGALATVVIPSQPYYVVVILLEL